MNEDISLEARMERMMQTARSRTPEEIAAHEKQYEELKRQRLEERAQSFFEKANIPKRHASTKVIPEGQWGQTYQKLSEKLATGFLSALVGTRGNGKTQLAVELVRENSKRFRSSKFCCSMEFFIDIKATFRSDKLTEKDVIGQYHQPELLIIDEVGQRSETEWENRLLFHLVNQRYEDKRDTLFIANLEPEALAAALGPSISSRMNETGGILQCNWPSFR
jgi:DNA replication protein DnaC